MMITFGDTPLHQEDLFEIASENAHPSPMEEEPKKEIKKKNSEHSSLLKDIVNMENNEEKLKACLSLMGKALASQGTPKFKEFWEAKKECLELFKHLTNSRTRSQLWSEYSTLSSEAKRLKEIKDEQSLFAAEQIDLAISALEDDLNHYETLLNQIATIEFLHTTSTLKKKKGIYEDLQKELNLLSTLTARVNGLRKELIRTEMRLGVKSKLFDRLSSSGDRIFPRRKELIKQISDEFLNDVEQFAKSCFNQEIRLGQDLYQVRDEIKVLQTLAKELTLNSQTFSSTRLRLSECWDQLKELEKAKKKEFEEKKAHSKESVQELKNEIEKLNLAVQEGKPLHEIEKMEQDLFVLMKSKQLTREDFRELKIEIDQIKKPLLEKQVLLQEERKKEANELKLKKQEELYSLETGIESLLKETDKRVLEEKIPDLQTLITQLSCSQLIKDRLGRKLTAAQDRLAKLHLDELFSKEGGQVLESLYSLLEEREERRQSLRELLESYRKAQGASGLDFEQAIYYQEAVEQAKADLDDVVDSIEEIENKIAKLEEEIRE